MAIRAEPTGQITFGRLAAETTATHGRVMRGNKALLVRELTDPVTVAANGQLVIDAGAIDIVFPAGELMNDGIEDAWQDYFDSGVQVDLMTDAVTVIATSGYSQQTHSAWTLTQEAD